MTARARWGDSHVESLLDLLRRQATVELGWLDERRGATQQLTAL
jgi:hypothetical protein